MSARPKNLCILGSTGSIGETTLRVVRRHRDRLNPVVLTARRNCGKLLAQAREFHPTACLLVEHGAALDACGELGDLGIELFAEEDALPLVVQFPEVDAVVCAMSGAAGLRALVAAILAGKEILFANKEALVVGGRFVADLVRNTGTRFIPIDSEHSAIYQCLLAGRQDEVASITLTASGGPFLRASAEEIAAAIREQVLAHPTWDMGPAVTVNSATMMNKALEVIEAHFLFGLPPDKIRVLIHPQSIIHGLVEFADGSTFAQLSVPDMAVAVQYALLGPERPPGVVEPLDLAAVGSLTFEELDTARFPLVGLAYESLSGEWWAPIALNAANEVAVEAFLEGGIPFGAISDSIMECFRQRHEAPGAESLPAEPAMLDAILEADRMFREFARKLLFRRG